MRKNTSVALGNYFESFLITLKSAIQEGLDSGIATNFEPQKHLESLKAKRLNG